MSGRPPCPHAVHRGSAQRWNRRDRKRCTGTAPRPADPGPVRARPHAPHPSAPEDRPRRRYELAFPHAFDGGEDRVVVRITGRTGAGGHPVYEDASGIVQAEISDRAEVRILATGARQEPPHGVTAHPLA
ncbi:DUF6296 family protein [Streptomyces sp. NPDC048331]|uniref:DUF6296 family protein n=1 Tax=Streptomyces sp. NPDC048331 TaxID=3365534 RepID=UPI003717A1DC